VFFVGGISNRDASNNATPVPFATSPQAALIDDHTKQQFV
jgi:hypothetical protein